MYVLLHTVDMNQERVRVVGVLTALVKRLQRTELAAGEEGGDIVCSVLLVDALVHCSNANSEGMGYVTD